MLRAIAIAVLLSGTVSGKLTGDHICQEEERFTVNVTEYFIRNATIRRYQWCLNVPPRCSFYTNKLINDSRIVEKEVADLVDKCCPGFVEHPENHTCQPTCPAICVHGSCQDGVCQCSSGYKGEFCNTACGDLEWGENCAFRCRCARGTCNPRSGSCDCPSGWTGTKCQVPCQTGSFGKNCLETCECKANEYCHHVTGECESLTSPENETLTTTTTEMSSGETFATASADETGKVPIKKTTKPYFFHKPNDTTKSTLVTFKNNGKFASINNKSDVFILNKPSSTTSTTTTEMSKPSDRDDDNIDGDKSPQETTKAAITNVSINDLIPITHHSEDRGNKESQGDYGGPHIKDLSSSTNRQMNNVMKSSKAKVSDDEKEVTITSTESSNLQEENYLNDEARKENVNQPPVNKSDIVNGASAATAISIAIIVIAVVIVGLAKCRINKKNVQECEEDGTKGVGAAVSVYTHSIFHTPLPDPPTFENPVFCAPTAEANNPTRTAPAEEQRFVEAHVVCSMNFPQFPAKDPRDYLYDHPPSTGSYRAASIPEPPDIDMQPLPAEPVYDEIPSGQQPTPIMGLPPSQKLSLYANTCGKTRL